MIIRIASPLDVFQGILDECCEQHDQCVGCPHLRSCRGLWDRASEQTYARPLTPELLQNYIDEFYKLWQDDRSEDSLFPQN